MSLLATLTNLMNHTGPQFLYVPIPPDHVDETYKAEPLESGRHYFRLWLKEMYLQNDRRWFTTWYPVVHSLVRCQYGQPKVEIPGIAGSLNLADINDTNLNRAVRLNYAMTTLIPFSGDTVEIVAGLLAMQGDNYLNHWIKVIGDFAKLLTVPQLSAALDIASKVADSVSELLNQTSGTLQLGLHQTFTGKGGGGGASLIEGYNAVILATEEKVATDLLWVVGGRLRYGLSKDDNDAFTGHTYMLLHIESREERDNLEALSSIQEPYNKAIAALGDGLKERAEAFLRTSVTAALLSSDLTKADRNRVADSLEKDFVTTHGGLRK